MAKCEYYTKIATTEPRYTLSRVITSERLRLDNSGINIMDPFGFNQILSINRLQKTQDASVGSKRKEILDQSRSLLLEANNFAQVDFFREATSDIGSKIQNPFNIPDDLYESILRTHIETFLSNAKRLKSDIPDLKSNFLKKVHFLHENGMFPISTKDAERRFDDITFSVIDPLKFTKAFNAKFDVDPNIIQVSHSIPREQQAAVFTHESVHALGGRTILLRTPQIDTEDREPWIEYFDEDQGEESDKIEHIKHGMIFTNPFEKTHSPTSWLDEAITECITQFIFQERKGSNAYLVEREVLTELTCRGRTEVPLQLFINAYFENYDPEKPYGKRLPAWNELQQAIREAYEPAFLVKLSKTINEEGLEAGKNLLNKRG